MTVLEALPTEVDVYYTVIVLEIYVDKYSLDYRKLFNFLKYNSKSSLGDLHHGSFNKVTDNNTIVVDDPEDKVMPGPLPNRRDHPARRTGRKESRDTAGHTNYSTQH